MTRRLIPFVSSSAVKLVLRSQVGLLYQLLKTTEDEALAKVTVSLGTP
jgi:hypothetical protein